MPIYNISITRFVLAATVAAGHLGLGLPFNARAQDIEKFDAFLANYCYSCHDDDVQKAELNLDALMRGGAPSVDDASMWENVLHMISEAEMPPEKKEQPSQADRDFASETIRAMLQKWTDELGENPGSVTARRLNRDEYNNTIRDLLGVDFQPAKDFPRDEVGYGFDNIGDVLSLSPVLMERYLDAAEQVAEKAILTDIPEWPPAKRYDYQELDLLSWEEDRFQIPLKGNWRMQFINGGSDIDLQSINFSDDQLIRDVKIFGKRVTFQLKLVQQDKVWVSVEAEEQTAGHLRGRWSSSNRNGILTANALPGEAFAGTWKAVASLPDGRDIDQQLELQYRDGNLEGQIKSDQGTMDLDSISAENGQLTVQFSLPFENQIAEVTLETKLRKGRLVARQMETSSGLWQRASHWQLARLSPPRGSRTAKCAGPGPIPRSFPGSGRTHAL